MLARIAAQVTSGYPELVANGQVMIAERVTAGAPSLAGDADTLPPQSLPIRTILRVVRLWTVVPWGDTHQVDQAGGEGVPAAGPEHESRGLPDGEPREGAGEMAHDPSVGDVHPDPELDDGLAACADLAGGERVELGDEATGQEVAEQRRLHRLFG